MTKKKILNIIRKSFARRILRAQRTPFHVVPKSPWPLMTSLSIMVMVLGMVLYFHFFIAGFLIFSFGFFSILFFVTRWFLDILIEGFKGNHNSYVSNGLRMGFILLIISEIMFFFSFFWSYFHFTFSLSIQTGNIWPYVVGPYPWALPLLNTLILALSSITLTETHLFFLKKQKFLAILFLLITIWLGAFFSGIQMLEYLDCPLSFSNGSCGSIFYMLTGFHGFHVFIGTIFLIVTYIRLCEEHFLLEKHILLEVSSLYWHFVDVIWFFLFFFVYIWGGF